MCCVAAFALFDGMTFSLENIQINSVYVASFNHKFNIDLIQKGTNAQQTCKCTRFYPTNCNLPPWQVKGIYTQ